MTKSKQEEVTNILGSSKLLLFFGGLVIVTMPFLFTLDAFYEGLDFSATGNIGDTIGGITAPFLSLIGSTLVFFALKAQVKANELISTQIKSDNEEKLIENETQNLNQLFSYLTENINGFHFKTLPIDYLSNLNDTTTDIEYLGGEAFHHLFSQIYCHYHGTPDELYSTQAVSELLNILKIMSLLLDKIKDTKSKNKEILIPLIKHLFTYKIETRIRSDDETSLEVNFCTECNCMHGLPDELRELILQIRQKLQLTAF